MPCASVVLLALAATPVATGAGCAANTGTQAELTQCARADLAAADAALNASYAKLMRGLSAPSQARLKASQRAWIEFRDRECRFRSGGEDGGSAAPMVAGQCAAELSRARTSDLEALLRCPEGDLACPR